MLTMGLGALTAAIRLPEAWAHPSPPDTPAGRVPPPAAPTDAAPGSYIFQDEFDGPAGQGPDLSKWTIQTWQDDVFPPVDGDIPRPKTCSSTATPISSCWPTEKTATTSAANCAATGGARSTPPGRRGSKLDCLSTGLWPSFWTVNEDPLPDGEVDIFEWYGNGSWPPGTTVHAASNGKTWEGKSIPGMVDGAWHTWRMRWDTDGFKFSRDGAQYFSVPPKPIHVHGGAPDDLRWPFNNPGYWMTPMFTLAVGGVGAGDPALGNFPAQMLVDYIRVW